MPGAGVMVEVILLHPTRTQVGGIVNATLFQGLSLRACGYNVEIWTGSPGLAAQAEIIGLPVFHHSMLSNSVLALFTPDILRRVFARRGLKAVVNQGYKGLALSFILAGQEKSAVVFHNNKMRRNRFFRKWIALSQSHADKLSFYAEMKGLKREIAVVPNGPLPSTLPACEPLTSRSKFRLGYIGRFVQKKGVEDLLRALTFVSADMEVLLVGGDPAKAGYLPLVESLNIKCPLIWKKWLRDTSSFYSSIDCLCVPSLEEPFGIVLVEAMRAGLPVIATDAEGPKEIVRHGETGWIVPKGNPIALAQAIEEAARCEAVRRAYGQAGHIRYLQHYSEVAVGVQLAQALGLESRSVAGH